MALPALPSTAELYPISNDATAINLASVLRSPTPGYRGEVMVRRAMTREERTTLIDRLRTINDALRPAKVVAIKTAILQMLVGLAPNRKPTDDDTKMIVTQFVAVLADLPYFAIARACLRFSQGQVKPEEVGASSFDPGWIPNTAQFRIVAEKIVDPFWDEQVKIANVLDAKVEEPPQSPEQREKMHGLLSGLADELRRGTAVKDSADRETRRDSVVRANRRRNESEQRMMLDEYKRLGMEPVYAGDVLVSPMLAKQLNRVSVK